MAFTSADLSTLDSAIASGVLKVRFGDGREVTYASTQALLQARAVVKAEVNGGTNPAGQDPLWMVGGVTYADFTRS